MTIKLELNSSPDMSKSPINFGPEDFFIFLCERQKEYGDVVKMLKSVPLSWYDKYENNMRIWVAVSYYLLGMQKFSIEKEIYVSITSMDIEMLKKNKDLISVYFGTWGILANKANEKFIYTIKQNERS